MPAFPIDAIFYPSSAQFVVEGKHNDIIAKNR